MQTYMHTTHIQYAYNIHSHTPKLTALKDKSHFAIWMLLPSCNYQISITLRTDKAVESIDKSKPGPLLQNQHQYNNNVATTLYNYLMPTHTRIYCIPNNSAYVYITHQTQTIGY